MRVHDELATVPISFGGRDGARRLHYRATAFLVGYPTPRRPRVGSTALVTARHNVLRVLEEYGNAWIRLNTRDGRARDVELTATWQYPDDPAVDLAAVPFYPPSSGWETLAIPTHWFVTEQIVATQAIGPGDELVVMGLLSGPSGTERNLPLVRGASIASMPLEPLVDQASGQEFSAYLAEVRSDEGLAGAPVFVALTPAEPLEADDVREAGGRHYHLLGLIREHRRRDAIATVTPATELIPLLERPAFVQFGRNVDRARAREPSAAQVSDEAKRPRRPSEYARFEDLARKLVNVPKTELDARRRGGP